MEIGVRVLGGLMLLLDAMLAALWWLLSAANRVDKPPTAPPSEGNPLAAASRTAVHPVLRMSASKLAEMLRLGEISSEKLLSIFISRVREVEPLLNAVVEERFEAAMEDARNADSTLDDARAKGGKAMEELRKNKPFLGVPVTVKESCSLKGMSLSVGSVDRAGAVAQSDGLAAAAMRKAGAIPMLITNTPELCLGWESTNLLKGATNNPYDLSRTAGGSSGGEAALISAGASVIGIGSDIAGSIRVPAMFTGIFGHKPTPGSFGAGKSTTVHLIFRSNVSLCLVRLNLVPNLAHEETQSGPELTLITSNGVVPIDGHYPSSSDENFSQFLTIGPMTRYAEDLDLVLRVLAGDKVKELNLDEPVDIKSLKVKYMHAAGESIVMLKTDKEIKDVLLKAVNYLENECSASVSHDGFPEMEESVEMSISVFFALKDLPNLLKDSNNPKRDRNLYWEIVKSVLGLGTRSLQALGFTLIHATNLFIPRKRAIHYHEKAKALKQRMETELGDSGVFIYPTFPIPAFYHNQVFTKTAGVMYTMIFNILGLPSTNVPLGLHSNGMPIGIQVVAAPYRDKLCLAVARQLEKKFGGWVPPKLLS